MTLHFHTRGCTLEPRLRESIEEQITSTFRRVQPSVDRIHVHLADGHGARDGSGKEVMLEVALRGAQDVIIAQRGANWASTVQAATQRAWHSTVRHLERRKKRQSRPEHAFTRSARTEAPASPPAASWPSALPQSAMDHAREEMF
jgi:ribosome-associated translation inhibitor RaiA